MVRVGYQGRPGSYAEAAAVEFSLKLDEPFELMALTTTTDIADALRTGRVAYGVAGMENTTAGVVRETDLALPETSFDRVFTWKQPIRHCMFVKDGSVQPAGVKMVASDEQALRQCHAFLQAEFPAADLMLERDTALAAENLAVGIFAATAAVICSRQAGTTRGLHLLREGIQDHADNATTFALFRLKTEDMPEG